MNEKINKTSEVQQSESELEKWKAHQSIGERLDDPDMVLNGAIHQIEHLYDLNRIDEARAFLDDIPNSVDLDQPQVREMLVDAYVLADDTIYFFDWYKQSLLQREANEGDQILVYALLCHNRNNEAREVFDKIFPALSSVQNYTYALQHIPKLITDKTQREFYYRTILERSQNEISDSND